MDCDVSIVSKAHACPRRVYYHLIKILVFEFSECFMKVYNIFRVDYLVLRHCSSYNIN